MATIEDVAKLCGVSTMTVSRVINETGNVRAETARKVNQAIKALNYRPNMIAKSLITKHTHIIAHVMVDIADQFHPLLHKGVEHACFEAGYSCFICDASSKEREAQYINMLMEKQIDGALFHHLNIDEELLAQLKQGNVKCVLIDNERPIQGACSLNTDDFYGGYLAAKHLIDQGHRRIGCVHGVLSERCDTVKRTYVNSFQYSIWRKRTRGFCQALRDHGIPIDPKLFYQGDDSLDFGTSLAPGILESLLNAKDRPTALYCENDLMGIGMVNALMECGKKVPDYMAVVGHDGVDLTHILYPRLTTIAQPRYEMGYLATKMLIQQIESKTESQSILLKPKLQLGQTT